MQIVRYRPTSVYCLYWWIWRNRTQWMASNRLKLNPAKTDFMWCATRRRQHQLSKDHVTFAGSAIRPSSTVRDLGVMLDYSLDSFGPHISQLVSRCFVQLRRIKSCSEPIAGSQENSSFVISRVDYCNSLLAGVPRYHLERLQSVMNTATEQPYISSAPRSTTTSSTCCETASTGFPLAARPVQAVSADVQGAAWTGTVVHRRPLSTSHNRR